MKFLLFRRLPYSVSKFLKKKMRIKQILIRVINWIKYVILTIYEIVVVMIQELLYGDHPFAIIDKNPFPPPPNLCDNLFVQNIKMFYEVIKAMYELTKVQFLLFGYNTPENIDAAMADPRLSYKINVISLLYIFILVLIVLFVSYCIFLLGNKYF